MKPSFSLICVTYGRIEEPKRLMESLCFQGNAGFELVLIDQNRDRKLDELVQTYRSRYPIQHIKVTYNNNTRARNKGVEMAKGEWISFPDDDCWYSEYLLEKVSTQIAADPDADLIYVNWADPLKSPKEVMFPVSEGYMSRDELYHNASCICFFVKRERFVRDGWFNEKLGLGDDTLAKAGEEQDLLLKLAASGAKVRKRMDLEVYHPIGHRAWNSYFVQRIVGSGAADVYLNRTYFGKGKANALLFRWMGGMFYNIVRFRKKNLQWYFYKLKGGLFISRKLQYEPVQRTPSED